MYTLSMVYKLKFTGTPSNNDSILISCSIFKLKKKEYRDFHIYTNGLKRLIDKVIKNNYNIIIFYDHSVNVLDSFMKLMKEYKNVKNVRFCKYYFPEFLDNDGYHKNIFGMYARLLPLFKKKIEYKILYISDIDLEDNELHFALDVNIPLFINSRFDVAVTYKIGYEWKYSDLYNIPDTTVCILSNILTKKHIPMRKIFFEFLRRLNSGDKDISGIVEKKNQIIKDYISEKNMNYQYNERQIQDPNDLFSYSIDELFTNKYLIPKLLNTKHKIGVFYIYDSLRRYLQYIVDMDNINEKVWIKYFKNVLGEFYTNNETSNAFIYPNSEKDFSFFKSPLLNNNISILINILSFGISNPRDNISISEKLDMFYKTLKRFVKYTLKLWKKYPSKKKDSDLWLINFKLHKKKGLIRQIFFSSRYDKKSDYNLLNYIKIYSLKKLIKLKNVIHH
jgi:hypothetical protein